MRIELNSALFARASLGDRGDCQSCEQTSRDQPGRDQRHTHYMSLNVLITHASSTVSIMQPLMRQWPSISIIS